MSDEEALKTLAGSEWFACAQADGQRRPDWHAGFGKSLKVRLDGRFSLEELQALIHFHPSTHV